ncbi:hypothetical protein QUB28_04910 [Microcoleus sp. B4-C3]|uniref:hypothetical protein n=1 Tax=Microcoleus sp. B4-C2 TaxID=2818661 RepID=UPI002FD6018C
MPVPQDNSLFVEQAGKPVLENGARCEYMKESTTRILTRIHGGIIDKRENYPNTQIPDFFKKSGI